MSENQESFEYPDSNPLASEFPIKLNVNGKESALFLGTPENLDELVIGYLYTGGMLEKTDDIKTLDVYKDQNRVEISTTKPLKEERLALSQIILSGSGPTLEYSPAFRIIPPIGARWTIEMTSLKNWARTMFESTVFYPKTGGMHCACLATESGALFVREDVGRHNAIDKVIGCGLLKKVDFSRCCLLTSGRIAADMILKIIAAGVPIVATRSIPTTTAFEIAKEKGVTLVGRIEDKKPLLYTHKDRILC